MMSVVQSDGKEKKTHQKHGNNLLTSAASLALASSFLKSFVSRVTSSLLDTWPLLSASKALNTCSISSLVKLMLAVFGAKSAELSIVC